MHERARHSFMGLDLVVGDNVLVPRSETELLGRTALSILQAANEISPIVIDMCCGSGNLACALAHAIPAARVYGADLTQSTVEAARNNAARLGLAARVEIRQGDLFAALADDGLAGRAAMIVCNPPYISTGKLAGESAHLLESEPREAFDGGPYGISILQRVVREAPAWLRPGGVLAFEFGLGQERQAASLLARVGTYADIAFIDDEAGRPRVATAVHRGDAS